jgi:hypothetical protein
MNKPTQLPPEPTIIINGQLLTSSQAMTIRVAIGSFISSMTKNGLGKDKAGMALAAGYIERAREVELLLISK